MTRILQSLTVLALAAMLSACSDSGTPSSAAAPTNPHQALADKFVKSIIDHDKSSLASLAVPNGQAERSWDRVSTNILAEPNKAFRLKSCGDSNRGNGQTCQYLILSNDKPIMDFNVFTSSDEGKLKVDHFTLGTPTGI